MTYSNIFKKSALALAAVGLLPALPPRRLLVIEQDINSLAFTVNVSGTQDDVVAGVFNVDNLTTGTSFLAFCFELLQGVNVNALTPRVSSLPRQHGQCRSADPVQPELLKPRFQRRLEVAGFQIALWETLDDKSLTSGSYQNWAGDTGSIEEDLALIVAETFLDNITLGAPGTGN
jgi:hypothetical protein